MEQMEQNVHEDLQAGPYIKLKQFEHRYWFQDVHEVCFMIIQL